MYKRLLPLFTLAAIVATVFCHPATGLIGTPQAKEWIQASAIEVRQEGAPVDKCKFEGNADFYGVGVRIGFYMLWLSGLMDFVFNPKSSVAIGDAQTIFDFANPVALIVLNAQQPPIGDTNSSRKPVFVPILLLYMFFGGAIVSATTTASFPRDWLEGGKVKKFSTAARQIFVHSTFLAMMGYAVYFFVRGFRNFDLIAPCKDVGPRIFPLADPVEFKNSPVVGFVLVPLVIILYFLILYVAIERYTDLRALRRRKVAFRTNASKFSRMIEWLRNLELPWTRIGGVLILISVVWSIVAIEWTIAINEIQGVNDISTTGQLIPFVIGVFSFPTTAWGIFKNQREDAHKSNAQKEDSELDTPLKNLTFADAGLESLSGVYTSINPRSDEQRDDFDMRPGTSEMREARTF